MGKESLNNNIISTLKDLLYVARYDLRLTFRDFYLNWLTASFWVPNILRHSLLKLSGIQIGRKSIVSAKCFMGGGKIIIGDGTFINYECFFDTSQKISIGDNVNIAMRCSFVTSTHNIGTTDHRASATEARPIIIGNGCWIGAGVTILPGVDVGKGTIIAAGSVVTKSCEPDSLYAGVPAKKIKDL